MALSLPSTTSFRAATKPAGASRTQHRAPAARAVVVRAQAGRQTVERVTATVGKAAAAAALAVVIAFSAGPATAAGLDTDTFKAGVGAKIEASDITKESASDVVAKLKDTVLPEAQEKLGAVAAASGSNYPGSVVQELKVAVKEVDALDTEIANGGDESVVKSAASGVEQQVNALKGLLGFD